MNSIRKIVVIFVLASGIFFSVTPSANATTLRAAAMASANTQKGAHYQWAGVGPYAKGYDCSGLIYWAYKQHGKILPRTAQAQYNKSTHISPANRRPGDLIFIEDRYNRVYHVGFYTGVSHGKGYTLNANSGATTKHVVGTWPVTNYTYGSPYAVYGRF